MTGKSTFTRSRTRNNHRGNRSTTSRAQRSQKPTLATGVQKEAGAAGGESGARAHGPALGGEAGSVLMGKLIRKVLPYATTGVVFTITCGVSATVARCSVSQSN